jgi:hypothetical protein
MTKWVYTFGNGKAEGRADMKNLLGGKGANLAEMSNLGIAVPAGFTITTEVCTYYYDNGKTYPKELVDQVVTALTGIEGIMGAGFGKADNPLLVSVRSGARASMPGMMDTVLNLGLNDQTVVGLIKRSGDARFAYDSYRRFIQMYSDVVLGVDHYHFEEILEAHKEEKGYTLDTEMNADDWKLMVERYKARVNEELGEPFPEDPEAQLWGAIGAVFGSWMNQRAITYRRLHDIPAAWGTAVNVQAMVFGRVLLPRSVHRRERVLRRVPGERPGRGRGGGHSHAPADLHRRAREEQVGPALHGRGHAQPVHGTGGHPRQAGSPLPRHAGHGIHHSGRQAVDAPDPQRQADGHGRPAYRRGNGQGGDHHLRRGHPARRARGPGPASAPHARPQGRA